MIHEVAGREKRIFSEHIFLLPLKIDRSLELSSEVWEREEILPDMKDGEMIKQYYSTMRYFDDSAKEIILSRDKGDDSVSNFLFRPLEEEQKSYYHISVDEYQHYRLELEKIRLRRFQMNGSEKDLYLLMIYTKNSRHKRLKDIKRINQYGSRLCASSLPYSEIEEVKEDEAREYAYSDCAQGLGIEIGEEFFLPRKRNEGDFEDDFFSQDLNYTKGTNTFSDWRSCIEDPRRAPLIEELIHYGSSKRYVPDYIGGDRMFVCYLIKNESLMRLVKFFNKEKFQYAYEFDENVSKLLYSIIYVDADLPSCQSQVERTKLLKHAIYDRGIEEGVIHAVTKHSFGCICSSASSDTTIPDLFGMEYVEMAAIVFMQRAELLQFSKRLKKEEIIFEADHLLRLQEEYILFKNRFLLFEVTTQDQGYHLYRKMQEELCIEADQRRVENRLQTISERMNIKQNKEMNEKLKFLGTIGLVIAIVGIILAGMELSFQLYTLFFN